MRMLVAKVSTVAVAMFVVASTSCGVIADDNAAVVGGVGIPASTIEAMVSDEALSQLVNIEGSGTSGDASVIPAAAARSALDLAIQVEVLVQEAEDAGATITTDDADLREQVGDTGSIEDLSDASRDLLARYVNANTYLSQSGAQPDPLTEDDALLLYESFSPEHWNDRTCMNLLTAPSDRTEEIQDLLDDGAEFEDLGPTQDDDPAQIIDVIQTCDAAQLAQLPPELGEAIQEAGPNGSGGPVTVDLGADQAGQPVVLSVWFEVESGDVSREDALVELQPFLEEASTTLVVATLEATTVNPRFGSGIEVRTEEGQNGPVLFASVAEPKSPAGVSDVAATP